MFRYLVRVSKTDINGTVGLITFRQKHKYPKNIRNRIDYSKVSNVCSIMDGNFPENDSLTLKLVVVI